MKMLELFSGSKAMSETFKANGWQTFTVDSDETLEPDLCADISRLSSVDLLNKFVHPDVIWSSPPCNCFSVAAGGRYFKFKRPQKQIVYEHIELHKKALKLVLDLDPKYWFIENPKGHLRDMAFMRPYPRYPLSQCMYGNIVRKNTDIWTNHPNPDFKKCNHPEGAHPNLKLITPFDDGYERGVLPRQLCEHIVKICNGYKPIYGSQVKLAEYVV